MNNSQIILVASSKGGIGASTISSYISQRLSNNLGRTLYIDVDNGYSYSKSDLNFSGNTKLDFLTANKDNLIDLIDIAIEYYNYLVVDIKAFMLREDSINLINRISNASSLLLLPLKADRNYSRYEIEMNRFFSLLKFPESTTIKFIINDYPFPVRLDIEEVTKTLPIDLYPNIRLITKTFPIIRNESNSIDGTLDDIINQLLA